VDVNASRRIDPSRGAQDDKKKKDCKERDARDDKKQPLLFFKNYGNI
jgi:hypothetical protein